MTIINKRCPTFMIFSRIPYLYNYFHAYTSVHSNLVVLLLPQNYNRFVEKFLYSHRRVVARTFGQLLSLWSCLNLFKSVSCTTRGTIRTTNMAFLSTGSRISFVFGRIVLFYCRKKLTVPHNCIFCFIALLILSLLFQIENYMLRVAFWANNCVRSR